MRILYVSPMSDDSIVPLMAARGYHVQSVSGVEDALKAIAKLRFNAALIAENVGDSEAFEFISKVHHAQPELLVFQMSVWRAEVVETLELLETIGGTDDRPQA